VERPNIQVKQIRDLYHMLLKPPQAER